MQTHACPTCGAPLAIGAPGAIERCPFCGAETREDPGPLPAPKGQGVRADRPPAGQFLEVDGAVVDATGNIYCAGTLPGTQEDHDDCYEAVSEFYVHAVWACDSDLRPRWTSRTKVATRWLGLHVPECLTIVQELPGRKVLDDVDDPHDQGLRMDGQKTMTVSLVDGSPRADAPEPLSRHRQAFLDADGTYVVATDRVVSRLQPREGWKEVSLFPPEGLLARAFGGGKKLDYRKSTSIALASDGDLVVHSSEGFSGNLHFRRFDRRGHVKLEQPSPLIGTARLVAGLDGIVWAFNLVGAGLCAVTASSVHPLTLSSQSDDLLVDVFVSMPDGSLLFFGAGPTVAGRVVRAFTSGPSISRTEISSIL